jgi:DNA-binding transcriptional ArsR family regulator
MLEIKVGRQLTQRRSLDETKENVEYLANLPRNIAFSLLHPISVDEPVQQGLLWYYRGVIRYTPKPNERPERIEKHRLMLIGRVRRACQHKRWGRSHWHIEGELPPGWSSPQPDATSPQPGAASPQSTHEERGQKAEPHTQPASFRAESPRFSPELPAEDDINALSAKFGMVSDSSRLKIILILGQTERNVTELCDDLKSQSQPAVSHHLALLRHSRLVQPRREGKHNYYELTDEGHELLDAINTIID